MPISERIDFHQDESSRLPVPAPSEEIAGLVERVTFFNEESGFAVLRVKVQGQRELVTIHPASPTQPYACAQGKSTSSA